MTTAVATSVGYHNESDNGRYRLLPTAAGTIIATTVTITTAITAIVELAWLIPNWPTAQRLRVDQDLSAPAGF